MELLTSDPGAPIPATNAQGFLFLGMLLLFVATHAWTQRETYARKSRERFEKMGWTWFARLVPSDRRNRRILVGFAVAWGALGILSLIAGVVFAFLGM
ncbi:SdpI/YhfL family protein [Salinibacterium sp. NYA9b]